jgi:predicted aspartyl protease
MGLTYIRASIANPARPRRSARLKFLVDSGALYSVVPAAVLRRLGIKPGRSKSFILADGTEVRRSLGQALFRLEGEEAASPVIFGAAGDSVLLGSVSLEALGLMLDPLKRELRPLPMMLAAHLSPPPKRPTALAPLGERVARNRRFHQPGRAG